MLDIKVDTEEGNEHKGKLKIKVYLVFVPTDSPKRGEPNFFVYAAKLRQKDAEKIVETIPNSYWKKIVADKGE